MVGDIMVRVITDGNEVYDVPAWEEAKIGTWVYFVDIDHGIAIRKGDSLDGSGFIPIYNLTAGHIYQEDDEEIIKNINEKLEVYWK